MTSFLERAARGRTGAPSYLLAGVVGLSAGFLLFTVLALGLFLSNRFPATLWLQLGSPSDPVLFFGFIGVLFATLLAGFCLAVRLIQRKRFSDVFGPWRWSRIGLGAAVWTALLCLGTGVSYLAAPHAFAITVGPRTASLAGAAAVGLVVQTLAEEWVFRGWLTQGMLLATGRPWPAAILSALVFGAAHILNGWPQTAWAVMFGLAASRIAIAQGGLSFTYGVHLANNLFGAVVVVSAQDVFKGSPGLFTQLQSLPWLDLPTGLVGLLLVTAAALQIARRPPEPDGLRPAGSDDPT